MLHKEVTIASLRQRMSVGIALAFVLRVVAAQLGKPELATTNNKTVPLMVLDGISQQDGNSSGSYAKPLRGSKALKMDSQHNLTATSATDRPASWTARSVQSANKNDKRASAHQTNSKHHYSASHSEREDKRKIYVTNEEDYSKQHYQNYQQDDSAAPAKQNQHTYSTIPVDQGFTGYDEPYYEPYSTLNAAHTGPALRTPDRLLHEELANSVEHARGCECPGSRRLTCDNASADFIALVASIFTDIWALVQLIASSSLPFLIPMLIIKLILVPIGIIKFLALIKLFLKLFIILPFFVRHVYPAFVHTFNLHDLIFQKIQHVATHLDEHNISNNHDEDIESRDHFNASSAFHGDIYNSVNETTIWDLRGCPTRVACELGAFFSTSTYSSFPQKLASYLSKRAFDRTQVKSKTNGSIHSNELDNEDEDEEQDQAFRAFLIALGKKWTQQQCRLYSCSVLF